jgi:hypothetical protein
LSHALREVEVFALVSNAKKNLLNLIKEWRKYGVFGVKGFNAQLLMN